MHIKKTVKYVLCCMAFVFVLNSLSFNTYGYVEYSNTDKYDSDIIIQDDAELLTDYEESQLERKMSDITKYGNVAFYSTNEYSSSSAACAKDFYLDKFGRTDGTVFLIDMYNRNIYIYSHGKVYDTITTSYANIITDNTYEYASDEEYFECAMEVYDEMYTLLSGHRIAQPMKYISNAFISVCLSMMFAYFIARYMSKTKRATDREEIQAMLHGYQVNNPEVVFIKQTRRYDPPSSSSSGGGSSGGGGGGGGGGGHSF